MKRYIYVLLALVSIQMFTACADYLEEKPKDFISPTQVPNSLQGAELLLNGVLSTLNDGPFFRWGAFPKVLEFDSDHATGPDWGMGKFGSGNFQQEWFAEYAWNGPYTLIHRANLALSKVEAMTFDEAARNNVKGQLQFLKAWSYFVLVRAYGDVPVFKKSIEEGEAAQQPRQPIKDVYAYIIELLQAAEGNLYTVKNASYVKGRISKGAASALLAKVYLTIASASLSSGSVTVMGGPALDADGNRIASPVALTHNKAVVAGYESFNAAQYFQLARNKAKEIMDNGDYTLFPNYMDIWKIENRNSGEHIWSLQAFSSDDVLGNSIANDYVGYLNTAGEIANGGWYAVRDHWYELFDDTKDVRVREGVLHRWKQWGAYRYYPAKHASLVAAEDAFYGYASTDVYEATNNYICRLRKFEYVADRKVERGDFHFPFLRYADVLLMFAEADNEVNGGPTVDAYEAVNAIRRRSHADDVMAGLNQQQFRSFVLEERGRELALEMNRRWDLVRWGIYLPVMNAIDIDENKILKRRTEKHLLYPIPISEINANEYINENNPGW